jgi:hypothetical protein
VTLSATKQVGRRLGVQRLALPHAHRPVLARRRFGDDHPQVGLAPAQRECAERAEERVVGAVEVRRARGEQPTRGACVGEQQRLLTRERRVERFDAIQALGRETVDRFEHGSGLRDIPERVCPHRDAARCVDDGDRVADRRARAVALRRRTVLELGDEQLRGVRDTFLVQPGRVVGMREDGGGEVRAPDATTACAVLVKCLPVDRPATFSQRVGHPRDACVAVFAELGERGQERAMLVVDPVAEQVEVLLRTVQGRDLDRRDDPHAVSAPGGQRLFDAVDGVVIGQREQLDARRRGARDDLRGRQLSVGVTGVRLQVEGRGRSPKPFERSQDLLDERADLDIDR